MGDYLEFPEVVQENRGTMHSGRLNMQSTGVVFRNIKTGKVDKFAADEVKSAHWLRRAKGYCLKIRLTNGLVHRYDGFKESDYPKVAAFLAKCYSKDLEKIDLSVKGWNWGATKFAGNSLEFHIGKKADYKDMSKQKFELGFDVPLPNVSRVTTGKNEVTMEFHQNDDAAVSLMEMRFHIPTDATTDDLVEDFAEKVRSKADILQATGDAIAMFSQVQSLTPRGRYDIKLYAGFLQLHGKTFDYKIPYSTVIRFFLLPHKDGRQVFFLVYLDPPIRQGQTRYPFLILLFNKDDSTTVELGLSEEVLQDKYKGKLSAEMTGLEYEIVSKLMKALVDKRITVPGTFTSSLGTKALDCAYKSSYGFLYPLERAFIYIHKPPIFIRFDEIASVNFNRSTAKTKLFDFDVETKAGTIYNFCSIGKEEYGKLYDFVKGKQLKVKNIGDKNHVKYVDNMDSDDDQHDAYLERMKQEGQEYESGEDDEESTDEDFMPGAEGSDVAEEFDSNAGNSSGDDGEGEEGEDNEKSPKKTKPKKEKASRSRAPRATKRSKKAAKDPNMPKRPMSGYFIWLNENRENIKKDNPGISVTEVSKVAGERWKEITDKSEWDSKAKVAKEKYLVAMETYKEELASRPPAEGSDSEDEQEPKEKKKRKPAKKSSGSPKKKGGAAAIETRTSAGAGDSFKSREFISDSSASEKSDAEPSSKKVKTELFPSKKGKAGSAKEETSPSPKKGKADPKKGKADPKKRKASPFPKKKSKKDESESEASDSESEVGSLPSNEEILSSPTASDDSGSDSDSGSASEEDSE